MAPVVETSHFTSAFCSETSAIGSSAVGRIGRLAGPPSYLLFGAKVMLHNALKNVRKFHQMSVSDAAAKIGVSASYISELENGKKRIHQDILEAYGRVFEMPVSAIYLISESQSQTGANGTAILRRKISKIVNWIAED